MQFTIWACGGASVMWAESAERKCVHTESQRRESDGADHPADQPGMKIGSIDAERQPGNRAVTAAADHATGILRHLEPGKPEYQRLGQQGKTSAPQKLRDG
ncbi:hypothetical protein GCM10009780_19280 [Actinomadura alba]